MGRAIHSKSENDTIKTARDLAADLRARDIVFLDGTLGAGKTVFARALIRALCGDSELEVVSPTFTLVQRYSADIAQIDHYDLYRIEDPEEIFELGWEDSLADGITIVEWPERLGAYAPASYIDVSIENVNGDERTINISRHPCESRDLLT